MALTGPQKKGKKCPFFDPCGVKSRGSGGAPPTHLILLRNQWRCAPVSPSLPRAGTHVPRGAGGVGGGVGGGVALVDRGQGGRFATPFGGPWHPWWARCCGEWE
jgi:hypothetical protein